MRGKICKGGYGYVFMSQDANSDLSYSFSFDDVIYETICMPIDKPINFYDNIP